MEQQLYKKEGRRYKPIGYNDGWSGFPAEGIWLVQRGDGAHSSECILRIGELQDMQPAVNLILGYKDQILKFLQDTKPFRNENIAIRNTSLNGFVLEMLKEITKQ